ncbi:DUF4124 domain-containing protein [Acinetobacter sp. ANC 3813]|uniref:DUF4124 domain-containing protein n=1 Tax=Acinetobacter sp. ANC 3813 TaxID=1977873 RepID=UPI003A0FD44B
MISALVFGLGTQSSMAQNFYKWVDVKGSTHYTATPPPNSAKKKGKVETYGWKNSSAAANEASPAAQSAAKEAEKAAQAAASQENKPANMPQAPAAE